ncbi:MAG: hypothetical protein ABFS32_04710 [Bacteroidota bacterium]
MKQDKLESFIKDNREALEEHVPPDSVWQTISGKLPEKRGKSTLIYWRVAAIIFFALSMGLLFKNYQTSSVLDSYNNNNTELANTERYYLDVIKDQEVILATYLVEYPEIAQDFKSDLDDLGVNYQKLKLEYANTGNEEVLGALIKNLQLQQELLKNQLHIIQKINQENENISI